MSFTTFSEESIQKISRDGNFWNPGYGDDALHQYKEPHKVPLKLASAENLRGLATIISDYHNTDVIILPWQTTGKRQVTPGTGIQAGVKTGEFLYQWQYDVCLSKNNAVGDMYVMVTGRLPTNVNPAKRSHVLVREANYHPDGSQVFWPVNGDAFVVLLAPPGDDVKPEHFVAFYCDGNFGLHILPKVWHQPLYPINDSAVYISKQSATYACVGFDCVEEFGQFLEVPLLKELAR